MATNRQLKINRLIYSIGFLIWPFVTVLISFTKKDIWLKNLLWFFVAFSGYYFTISNDLMDANAYREVFDLMNSYNYNFDDFLDRYFSSNSFSLDFVSPVLSYTVSLFTDDYRILFAFMGLVFGFFYSRNMWFVLSKLPTKNGYLIKLLFLTFLVIVGFWQINGFRFWTATHIFFYATIPYILNQNKKSLWFLPLAILTHFSFILPSLVILAFHFTKNKSKIFFYFFLLSLLFVGINLSVLENYVLSFLPSIFQAKVDVYTNQEYVSEVKNSKESLSTLAVVFRNSLPIYISLLFFVIGTKYFKLVKKDKVLLNLFNFTLLLMGVSNILSIIPSVGRFRTVSFMFALCFLILFLSKKNILYRLKIFAILLTPLLIGYCFGILRLAANKIGNTTFIGNPFFILLERIS